MLWNDARLALRQLRKSPGFTVVVLATLALCIGANTAIFSVLDAVLFRQAPFPDPDRLALLVTAARGQGSEYINTSQTGALYEAVRDRASLIDCAAWSGIGGANFAEGMRSEFIQQQRIAAGYFRVMGIAPMIGREFTRAEDVPGGPAIAVLNHEFWQRQFHGDPSVVGKAINLKGEPYTVVAVMPRDFPTTQPVDVWTPLRPSRRGEGGGSNYGVTARLRAGATMAAANEELRALSQALHDDPAFPRELKDFEERLMPLTKGFADESRTELLVTWGAVLTVLLIGCVNIAGLLLARSGARGREIATRMALGGSRAAIVRQLLMESALLAMGGGVIGIGLGGFALDGLKRMGAEKHQLWLPIELDGRVMAAMIGIALLTSLLFGLAPALATTRLDIRSVLVEGGRGVAGTRRRWSRQALVAAEVALSLTLLVGAGLMLRTLSYLNGLTPGFDTHHLIAAEASLQDARYKQSAACDRLFRATLERIRRIPGVTAASVALTLPYERPLNSGVRVLDGDRPAEFRTVEVVYTTPEYLDTMRIPLIEGRAMRDTDTANSGGVAVVSRSFAEKYLKGRSAAGAHLAMGKTDVREIVGVVGDVQQHSGINGGPLAIEPTVYVPASQLNDGFVQLVHTWFSPKWVIRTGGPAPGLPAQVRAAISAIDPLLPVARFRTVEELAGRYTEGQRYLAALFSTLAGLALLLAAIGLYGLISHSVTQRRHELGIRMALGATTGQTIAGVIRPAIVLAAAGVALGLVLSSAGARLMKSLVFGVRENDPATFAAMAVVLLLVAAGASLAPALRVLKMDPAETLRSE